MNFVQCGQNMDATFDLGFDLFFEQDLLPVLDSQPNVISSLEDMDNSLSDMDILNLTQIIEHLNDLEQTGSSQDSAKGDVAVDLTQREAVPGVSQPPIAGGTREPYWNDFSDISEDELVKSSQEVEKMYHKNKKLKLNMQETHANELFSDISENELVRSTQECENKYARIKVAKPDQHMDTLAKKS